jgi:aconitate hydratase 2/2-methylisocitrate dehydratase
MDQLELTEEGYYGIYGKVGARTEIPGCSLCMGNQARVADNATVVSTSTRNFPNRMGAGAKVFLASAELAAVCSSLGRIPSPEEYMSSVKALEEDASDTYRYLNFDQIPDYVGKAKRIGLDATA